MIQTCNYICYDHYWAGISSSLMIRVLTPIGCRYTYVFSKASLVWIQINLSFLVFIEPFSLSHLVFPTFIRMLYHCQSQCNSPPPYKHHRALSSKTTKGNLRGTRSTSLRHCLCPFTAKTRAPMGDAVFPCAPHRGRGF